MKNERRTDEELVEVDVLQLHGTRAVHRLYATNELDDRLVIVRKDDDPGDLPPFFDCQRILHCICHNLKVFEAGVAKAAPGNDQIPPALIVITLEQSEQSHLTAIADETLAKLLQV
ncbi:MAG: hypothetical protein ACJ74H_13215 [Thermoanaerobaculia bacterium]